MSQTFKIALDAVARRTDLKLQHAHISGASCDYCAAQHGDGQGVGGID